MTQFLAVNLIHSSIPSVVIIKMEQVVIEGYYEPYFGTFDSRIKKLYIHDKKDCSGRCAFHNPSDHHMRDWPMYWRADTGVLERQCEHGIGHPDPDQEKYFMERGEGWKMEHGCDGCCY